MAAAPAPARVPAHLQYRVQLLFVTEEQLFGAGPLSPSTAKSLRLEVHPAGEEADATVTDGEVQGATHARESRSEVVARVRACAGCGCGESTCGGPVRVGRGASVRPRGARVQVRNAHSR